jgi:hypothetical protein
VPEDLDLTPDEAVTQAQELLDAGLPFSAHEVLEGAWKAADEADRELWRALAQLAVGLTHAARGNPAGATALLRRAAAGLTPYEPRPPHGIDATGLARWARHHADLLSVGDSAAPLPAPHLRHTPPS